MSSPPIVTRQGVPFGPPRAPRPTVGDSARADGYRRDIDGLRAIAILLVVAFHAGLPFVPAGFVGVDVFFVISGFLISALLLDELQRTGTLSLTGFYARRARRLLPALALVLVAVAVASWVLVAPLDHPRIATELLAAAMYVANWHFAGQSADYFATDVVNSPVLHYWSLSVEEQFYVIWPLLLTAVVGGRHLAKYEWERVARRIAVSLAVLAVGSLAISIWTSGSGPWAYYGLHTRIWELAIGGGLALARPYLWRLPALAAASLGWVGMGAIVGSAVLLSRDNPYPSWLALWPVLGTAAIIVAGAQPADRVYARLGPSPLLSTPPMRHIGHVSYSWYLWHWPALIFAGIATGAGANAAPWIVALAVAVSFGLAELTYRYVENPARRSAWLGAARARSLALGFGLTAVAAASAVILATLSAPAGGGAVTAQDSAADAGISPAVLPAGQFPDAVMSLSEARVDRVDRVGTMGDCALSFTGADVVEGCAFGSPKAVKRIALVGDSHAQHWLPAFAAIAEKRGWQVHAWSKGSCAVADVRLYIDTFSREYTECGAWRQNLERRLKSMPKFDALIIGRSQGHAGRLVDVAGNVAAEDQRGTLWRGGTQRMLDRFGPVADHIVILGDTPWPTGGSAEPRPDSDVPYCLSGSNAESCAFPAAGHTHLDAAMVQAEVEAIAERPGVSLLDPTPLVCPGEICPVVSRTGVVMYSDNNHLTTTFSRSAAPALERLLLPQIGLSTTG